MWPKSKRKHGKHGGLACMKLWMTAVCLGSQASVRSSRVDVWSSRGQNLNFGIYPLHLKDYNRLLGCHRMFTVELSWRRQMIKTCICTIFRSKSDIFCGLFFVCFCFGFFSPQVKGIENWVSASGIIQMEAPVFCSSRRRGTVGWENSMQTVQESHRSHWPLAFLAYQKTFGSFQDWSNDLALMYQTNNTSVVPLRTLDPKEISKGFPLYFGPIPFKTKASHRSDKKSIWQDSKRLFLFFCLFSTPVICIF